MSADCGGVRAPNMLRSVFKYLQKDAYDTAVKRGKWSETALDRVAVAVLDLVDEVEEAREAWHEYGDSEAFTTELADIVICAASIAEELEIDLGEAVERKMEINRGRIPGDSG